MEVSGIVFRPIPSSTGAGIDVRSRSSLKPSVSGGSSASSRSRCWRPIAMLSSDSEFCDNGHVQYYHGSTTPEIRKKDKDTKKSIKKRLKLVKGLSKDLSMFSDLGLGFGLGFGLEPHNHGLVDQVKARTISEATDVLLGQLQQLRAEEKEMKRKRKEEKAKLKAAKRLDCESSSSSSSSDSSDSECERGKVVDMSCLKSQAQALAQPPVKRIAATTSARSNNINTDPRSKQY